MRKNPVTQPYFGPQELSLFKSLGYDLTKDTYVKYNDIVRKLLNDPQKRFTEHWDEQAKVPWLSVKSADGKALFAISYENPRSVAIKADYIKEKVWLAPCSGSTGLTTRTSSRNSWRSRLGSRISSKTIKPSPTGRGLGEGINPHRYCIFIVAIGFGVMPKSSFSSRLLFITI